MTKDPVFPKLRFLKYYGDSKACCGYRSLSLHPAPANISTHLQHYIPP